MREVEEHRACLKMRRGPLHKYNPAADACTCLQVHGSSWVMLSDGALRIERGTRWESIVLFRLDSNHSR